jgi:hypothetical protein
VTGQHVEWRLRARSDLQQADASVRAADVGREYEPSILAVVFAQGVELAHRSGSFIQ